MMVKRPNTFAIRARDWATGLGVTSAPFFVLVVAQYLMVPQFVARIGGLGLHEQALAIAALRNDWLILHTWAAVLLAVYWLLAAALAGERFLRIKRANIVLALSVALYAFATLFASIVPNQILIDYACPMLGISDADAGYGFDVQSSCQIFSQKAYFLMVFGLIGLALLLLSASIVQRVSLSRLPNRV